MIEVKEVLYLWTQGISKKAISRTLGMSKNTVREILTQASGFGLQPNSTVEALEKIIEKLQEQRNQKPVKPNTIQAKLACYHDQIATWRLTPNMTITQMVRLFAELGEILGETSLRTYIRNHFDSKIKTTVHMVTTPGQQAQVDFGYVGLMKDPISLKMRKSYAFIMTLSHSRHRFVRFVFRQDSKTWVDCHIRAFNFFNGVPHTILLDNLKAGVTKPDIYDPILNRTYGELEKHYKFIIDPAKIRIARHKGKVERSVTIVRQQILAGRTYESIDIANDKALTWCKDEIAHRITRTTGKTPWDLYLEEDKPALKPLPKKAFECPTWQEGLVHRDLHIVFGGSFYSIPHQYVNKKIWIRATEKVVQCFADTILIKTHVRASCKGSWVTDHFDYPESAREFLEKDEAFCLSEAKKIGPATLAFITSIITPSSLTRRRKAQAILRLGVIYGEQRLEDACLRAVNFGNTTYESIKNILEKNLDKQTVTLDKTAASKALTGVFLRAACTFSASQEACS